MSRYSSEGQWFLSHQSEAGKGNRRKKTLRKQRFIFSG